MSSIKIIAISSSGGHLSELMKAIPKKFSDQVAYITSKNGHSINSLNHKKHFFIIDPHVSILKYIYNSFQSVILFFKIKPKVVISTGSGIAIPMILISWIFGVKIIFIESGARIYNPSRTGNFIYKFSDLFIIQYKELKNFFPNSKIGSL